MDRIVFIRANYGRKANFRIRTVGILRGDELLFRKESIISGRVNTHLVKMIDVKKAFEKRGLGDSFGEIGLEDGGLAMDNVSGENLEDKLLDSILSGNEKDAIKMLEIYEKIINSISVNRKDAINKNFPNIFNGKLEECFSGKKVVSPGLIDLSFDNIILSSDGPKVIDYEWSFEECIPTDYILYRSIMWLSLRYSYLFKLYSKKFSFVRLSDNMLIPKFMYERYKNLESNLRESYELEKEYFQPWATGVNKMENIKFASEKYEEGLSFALDEAEELEDKIRIASNQIESMETDKKSLFARIDLLISDIVKKDIDYKSILESRSYKLAVLISLPVRLIRRIVRR